jgi:hypothetical protein
MNTLAVLSLFWDERGCIVGIPTLVA